MGKFRELCNIGIQYTTQRAYSYFVKKVEIFPCISRRKKNFCGKISRALQHRYTIHYTESVLVLCKKGGDISLYFKEKEKLLWENLAGFAASLLQEKKSQNDKSHSVKYFFLIFYKCFEMRYLTA